ncbi:MAG: helix-turn-helix transcriptional regulator [Sphingomonadales bacterium]
MKKKVQEKTVVFENVKTLERNIGLKIRQRRLELGLTQQDLADKLGLSYQQVQKYETGLNRISAGRLSLVSRILLTRLDYFFDFSSIEKLEISKKRATTLALSGSGIDREVQAALANLVQALSQMKPK